MVMRSDVLSGFETVSPREGQEKELVSLGWMGHGLGRDGECLWGKWGRCYLEEEAGDLVSGHMGLP